MASPGEFEPASFVVRANQNIDSLQVQASNLTGPVGSIPSGNVDIRIVKCWYQAGETISNRGMKILTSELLLKDDSLVKVEGSENYLEVSGNYVWISNPNGISGLPEYPTTNDFPVQDSSTLQPTDIPANTNKQFWITVKVPDNASPGNYSGPISLSTPSGSIGQVQFNLQVLPINLADPYLTYSIFYNSRLRTDYGMISEKWKNEQQYRAELQNLIDHGITNPTLAHYGPSWTHPDWLTLALDIRDQLGMSGQTLYHINWEYPLSLDRVQSLITIAQSYGYSEIYTYGNDESKGSELLDEIPWIEEVHSFGGKVYQAGAYVGWHADPDSAPGVWNYLGDYLDMLVCGNDTRPEEAARWHSVGAEIFSYNNPQVGEEKPETYRRNFGLQLWQNDYDGAMNFAYQLGFGHIWNDFDDEDRDHNFTYPTANGVIDTIQWEGQREGVDDVRYLTTLLNTIEITKSQGKNTTLAENYVTSLKSSDLSSTNLDLVRSDIIDHILSLQ